MKQRPGRLPRPLSFRPLAQGDGAVPATAVLSDPLPGGKTFATSFPTKLLRFRAILPYVRICGRDAVLRGGALKAHSAFDRECGDVGGQTQSQAAADRDARLGRFRTGLGLP